MSEVSPLAGHVERCAEGVMKIVSLPTDSELDPVPQRTPPMRGAPLGRAAEVRPDIGLNT